MLLFCFFLACCLPATETPETTAASDPAVAPVTVTIAEKVYPYNGNQELGQTTVAVKYAVVTLPDPTLQAAINALLTPEAAMGADANPGDCTTWDARVVWNADGVLQVAYDVEYVGAYLSSYTFHVPVDTRAGRRITAADAFGAETSGLKAKIDAELAKLRAAHEADIKREIPDVTPDDPLMSSLADAHITDEALGGFELDATGVRFDHDYGTPHVALALLPPDTVTIDWATMATLVNPSGPLAAVARAHQK